ncbi:hypothetical protein JMN32_12655 [Fulvivirga sp. 29W222]|uniref:Uncharacterized protein n=1 Tax=Fulvivirga marina TaxID=2494733 RepID=A0A937FW73_9BACT|nr:hypothetical protein [Fulvivirga marina]MBL6447164.1 hypothetical protein [Fulvivirga marina]
MRKKIVSRLFFFIILFICPPLVYGQQLQLIDSILINAPVSASIDRLNQIYIADKRGNLSQYKNTHLVQIFSPQQTGNITLIEAWNPLKIFIFYADFQEYLFLDRFLSASQRYQAPELSRFSGMMTLSNDNNLWIVDYINFGLKKYDINFGDYTINTPFDLILNPDKYEITFIREYQNLVFISDKNSGILVFDNLGNYLKKIQVKGVNHFSFTGDELYYISGNDVLIKVNIYSDKRSTLSLPQDALFAFLYDNNKLALISEKALNTYSIKEN